MTYNHHDFAAMNRLAGAIHESGHAVVALKLGHQLRKLTRYETTTGTPPDASPIDKATVVYAGAASVIKFDNHQGRHGPEDSGDRANIARLNLSPADSELARSTAAAMVDQHYEKIVAVALALDAAPNGELSPERVSDILDGALAS